MESNNKKTLRSTKNAILNSHLDLPSIRGINKNPSNKPGQKYDKSRVKINKKELKKKRQLLARINFGQVENM